MENQPPNPEQNPAYPPYPSGPTYGEAPTTPLSQPYPPSAQPQPPYSQQFPPTYPPQAPYSQPLPPPGPGYAPPSQGYAGAPYPVHPAYAPYPPQAQDNTLPIVLEVVCSLFGVYGIGWLIRGRTGTGIALLIGGFVWVAVAVVITILTFGLGAICFGPLHLAFIVGDTLWLHNELQKRP